MGAVATGRVDFSRVVIWGQSYGGYAALVLAARTRRFRAVIAQSAPTDLLSLYGSFGADAKARPGSLDVRDSMMGYLETGQGGMGAPPWTDPMRYVRNSPILMAAQITAPVLLVAGEQDFFPISQSEEMFSALQRLDRDVRLLSFPGEGHTLTSPSAIAAYQAAALAFLDGELADPSPSPPRGSSGSPPRVRTRRSGGSNDGRDDEAACEGSGCDAQPFRR